MRGVAPLVRLHTIFTQNAATALDKSINQM